jgi:Xaa-Pro aminopeptidase
MSTTELPAMDVGARAGRVRTGLDAAGVDALLVSHLPNVRYLTGFTGSAGLLLVTPDGLVLFSDGRYRTQAHEQLAACGVAAAIEIGATSTAQREALARAVAPYHRVGLEAAAVTWAEQRQLAARLGSHDLVATDAVVERYRRVKEPAEVARIRQACAIADDALAELLPTLRDGPSEREFALALEVAMRRRGASGLSFPSIVASGPNAAMPHARPSDRRIEHGEMVVIDFGCIVDGYCSDMTRTVSIGDPGPQARRVWDVVRDSQWAGREAVRAGAGCAEVDRACRDVIAAAGWADAFVHSTGHGVGLEIHEAPRVAASARDTLEPGWVVTVEPGVYLPGIGGVRIEDTLVVTPDGAEPLTAFPKEMVL